MSLIRPRLTDFYNIHLAQEEIDFAIPYLDEDIPFCVDPFLMWKSPSQQDNALHSALINSFNYFGKQWLSGHEDIAIESIITSSECNEVGLGFSATRKGVRIGVSKAREILNLFKTIPEIEDHGFIHFEEIQLYIDQISKDRISDISCSLLKSFLIDYTIDQCDKYGISSEDVTIQNVYDQRTNNFNSSEKVRLPINPDSRDPVLFVPKRWLRKSPWINGDDYIKGYFISQVIKNNEICPERGEILNFNRENYDVVQSYIKQKERIQQDCSNDPLFTPVPVLSAKRKMETILALPKGKTDNADRKFENLVCQLMASVLYPHLDFAAEQSRTDSGVLIRDLVFYNNRNIDFLNDIYEKYETRQIVMELKNVNAIDRNHINQLNRYIANDFGGFGIFITRNPLPKAMFRNTIDLWSGQRKCIIALTDADLSMMVELFESKQRNPIDVIKKKYVEFVRACPG